MYVFLGGKSSKTTNKLASAISANHAVKTQIIPLSELEGDCINILRSFPGDTKFILSFSNKKNELSSRLRSSAALRTILLSLKQIEILDTNIILLGSDSYLGSAFERYCSATKNGLLRDPYAFDSVSKYLVTREIFPNIKIVHVPSLHRKRSLVKQLARTVMLWMIAKLHSKSFHSQVNETTYEKVAHEIVTSEMVTYDETIKTRFQLKFTKILNYTPKFLLKFHASVISVNKNNTRQIGIKDTVKLENYKYQYYIVTPLNCVDDNFNITLQNITAILAEQDIKWVICVSKDIYNQVYNLVNNNRKIIIEREKYPSLYGAYNTFINIYEKSNAYYIPLSAGDVLFSAGLKSIIEHCETRDELLVFGNVIKHGKYVHMGMFNRKSINSGTHKLVTGHSAACLIKLEAHQKFGKYDLSYRLAADNCFFEKIYKGSPNRIGSVDATLGYFPPGGISQNNYIESYTELFRSRIENDYPLILESIYLFIRILRISN